MTILHKGLWPGKLVPSSHKRSELRHTINRLFSRETKRIMGVIPVSDSPRKEVIFIGVCTSSGYLKCQRVLISAVPNLGNKAIFTFQTFV